MSYFALSQLSDVINFFIFIPKITSTKLTQEKSVAKPLAPPKSNEATLSTDNTETTQDNSTALLDADQVQPTKLKEERTFVIYENQRWWPKKGWMSQLFLGERSAWSDELGKVELSKENFKLPSDQWSWLSGWNVSVSPHSDKEGWEYASSFKKFKDPLRKKSFIEVVRRRKWTRGCVCV